MHYICEFLLWFIFNQFQYLINIIVKKNCSFRADGFPISHRCTLHGFPLINGFTEENQSVLTDWCSPDVIMRKGQRGRVYTVLQCIWATRTNCMGRQCCGINMDCVENIKNRCLIRFFKQEKHGCLWAQQHYIFLSQYLNNYFRFPQHVVVLCQL